MLDMRISHLVSCLSTSTLRLQAGTTQGTCHPSKASITYINSHGSTARRKMISNSSFRKPISPRHDMLSPRTIIMLCQTQTGTRIFSPFFLSFFLSVYTFSYSQVRRSVCLVSRSSPTHPYTLATQPTSPRLPVLCYSRASLPSTQDTQAKRCNRCKPVGLVRRIPDALKYLILFNVSPAPRDWQKTTSSPSPHSHYYSASHPEARASAAWAGSASIVVVVVPARHRQRPRSGACRPVPTWQTP